MLTLSRNTRVTATVCGFLSDPTSLSLYLRANSGAEGNGSVVSKPSLVQTVYMSP